MRRDFILLWGINLGGITSTIISFPRCCEFTTVSLLQHVQFRHHSELHHWFNVAEHIQKPCRDGRQTHRVSAQRNNSLGRQRCHERRNGCWQNIRILEYMEALRSQIFQTYSRTHHVQGDHVCMSQLAGEPRPAGRATCLRPLVAIT